VTGLLSFLTSDGDVSRARTGLLIQTGSADLLAKAIDQLRSVLPEMALTVLRQREMDDRLRTRADVRYLDNLGSKVELLRSLRSSHFDVVFALYSNEGGFWKLKLLPYFVAPKAVIFFDEDLRWFPVTVRQSRGLAEHVRKRLESWVTSAAGGVAPLWAGVVKAITYPGMLAYLMLYEWRANSELASRGTPPTWKRSRPRPGPTASPQPGAARGEKAGSLQG